MPVPKPLAELLDHHEAAMAALEGHHVAEVRQVYRTILRSLEDDLRRAWRRVVGPDLTAEPTDEQLAEIRRYMTRRLRRLLDGALTVSLDLVERAAADGAVMGALHARRELGTFDLGDGEGGR